VQAGGYGWRRKSSELWVPFAGGSSAEPGRIRGFGVFKIKEGLIGIKGDHKVWKVWRDEFMANLP
jgi:hypothetical protein